MSKKKTTDPIAELGNQLAADHVLEKAKVEFDPEFPNGHIDIVNLPPAGLEDEIADHVEGHSKNLEKLEELALNCEFESGTLVGDIRDLMLRLYKERAKNWSQLSAGEQRDVVAMTTGVAKTVIRKVVRVVAEEDKVAIHASLKGYSASDGFDIKLKSNADEETALELYRMNGREVILTLADASGYEGQRKDPSIDEDQAPLPFADERREPEISNGDDSDLADEDKANEAFDGVTLGDVVETINEILTEANAGTTGQAPDAEYLPVDDDGNDLTKEQETLWNKINFVTENEPENPEDGDSWVKPSDGEVVHWSGHIWSSDKPFEQDNEAAA